MNSVLAIVHIVPGDRIIKEKADKSEVKPEVKQEVKEEQGDGQVGPGGEEGGEVKMEDGEVGGEDEDEDDEVPYIEDVGTREVAGFIVMSVSCPLFSCQL